MPLHKKLFGLLPPVFAARQIESGFGKLFPGAPGSEELIPNLAQLKALLAQIQDPDFIRNQVSEMFAKIPDTSTDFLQRVKAFGGSSVQANEQAQAARTQRNQSAIDLSNRLIQGGRQNAIQGLFGVAGIEQQGLFGAAGFDQNRVDAIQSFINSLLSGGAGVAGAAVGGGGGGGTAAGVSGRTQTTGATGFNPNFQQSFFPTQQFGNNRLTSPAEELGGNLFGGMQSVGPRSFHN